MDSDDDGFGQGAEYDSEEQRDEDVSDEEPPQQPQKAAPQRQAQNAGHQVPKTQNVKSEKVENQPFDLVVDVNDSEEIESEEEDDEVNVEMDVKPQQKNQQTQPEKGKPQQIVHKQAAAPADADADDDDERKVPGAYNPAQFVNLPVSSEVKELFEYINRYKPQKIDLDTKIRPFIPDFIPAVGEVDAFLKMPKPDGHKEDLGIVVLDEPALNHEDKTVLELKYVQSKNVVRATPMDVDSIEQADKKPKDISRWINAVQDLHKTRPAPTVNYTKNMPDFDTMMEEWKPEMEAAFKEFEFPGPEIDMNTADYAKLCVSMCDIPVHKLQNNKAVIESLHVMFTLFLEFRSNQHFQQQNQEPAQARENQF